MEGLILCKLEHHCNSFTISFNISLLFLHVIHTDFVNVKTVTWKEECYTDKIHLFYSDLGWVFELVYLTLCNRWVVGKLQVIWAQNYKCARKCHYLKVYMYSAIVKYSGRLFCRDQSFGRGLITPNISRFSHPEISYSEAGLCFIILLFLIGLMFL